MLRRLSLVALAVLLGAASIAAWRSWPRAGGARAVEPAHLVEEGWGAVDLAVVHEVLWPAVGAATSARARSEAVDALQAAVGDGAFAELAERVRGEPDPASARAIERSWNRLLDDAGAPWRLELAVTTGGHLYVKTYRAVSETRTRVGARAWRARVLDRADASGPVEAWLGATPGHEEGALIVLDRLVPFTVDRVWPLLDPALDGERDPVERAFAPAIRAGVEAALSADHARLLRATAADRLRLLAAARSVHGRHLCGSRFVVGSVPYAGLDDDDLRTLARYAAATSGSACPDVTRDEAAAFARHSAALRQREGLRAALGALVAWTARAFVVHEARHAADDGTFGGPPPCDGCPDGLSEVGAHELSAYLASLAHPEHGALAWYQACGLAPGEVPERARVVGWLATRLGIGCDAPPPADLAARARRLEAELFGRDEPIEVSDGFPASLPIEPPDR